VNDYELMLILDPELAEERQTEIVTRMRELIERGDGKWLTHDAWGRRRLAYEIQKKGEGAYHFVTFDAKPETVDEISRILRITDGVMRHMAVRRVRGGRTTAPPLPAPAPAPATVGAADYSGASRTNERSQEEEE
jgi:small subunit ribosomal protein S6